MSQAQEAARAPKKKNTGNPPPGESAANKGGEKPSSKEKSSPVQKISSLENTPPQAQPAAAPVASSSKPRTPSKPRLSGSRTAAPQAAPVAPLEEQSDIIAELWLRFGNYFWDVLGVSLIGLALLTLVGFIGLYFQQSWTQGILIIFWLNLVGVGFGWGWPMVAISLTILGLLCLRRNWKIQLGRVLAIELLGFSVLTLLAIFGGWSLENVEARQDGGAIGWGLATLLDKVLPVPWSTAFLVFLMLVLASYGFGVMQWAFRRLETWLDAVNPEGAAHPPAAVLSKSQTEEEPVVEQPELPQVRDPNLPPLTLLLDEQSIRPEESYIQETASKIEHTLSEFGVPAHVRGYRVGPTVTQYAVEPGFVEKPGPEGETIRQKVRVSQISALSRDLALALSAERLRIEAPVPGRSYVGIEVPNPQNSMVRMRSLLECDAFTKLTSPLAVVLGRDVSGLPVVADLSRMPHMLIAGTTGSGKSVCIAALVTCLVMNNQPEDLRLALLDPKMVELIRFNGLPHMFGKVETEVDRMLGVLRWALMEMDHRYRLLEDAHTRDIETYNRRAVKRKEPKLPRIVVFVDELADLMMTAPDQTEHSLIRLAQMARAVGIHLVVATQRPSTDVVTGLIKANFPARLAFSVASGIDSRVILDVTGAESLLGKGDMLFLNPEAGTPVRAQGALVSDEEVDRVIAFWKEKAGEGANAGKETAAPWEELIEAEEEEGADQLVQQAVKIVRATQRASTSLLQRRLRIGYPRAARLMDELEELGVVGPSMGGGREREVLEPPEEGDATGADDESGDDEES